MRELFEICPKIQFFKLFLCFLRSERGEFGQKRCQMSNVLMCQGQPEKIPFLSPGKMIII